MKTVQETLPENEKIALLTQERDQLIQTVTDQLKTLAELKEKNEKLQQQLLYYLRRQYGHTSERFIKEDPHTPLGV
jgi:cell shape-determining protein MreC